MKTHGGGYFPSPPPFPFPFHLLEISLISAQDLFPFSPSMRTYAVAYLHSHSRLRTRLDAAGHTDPTWNDKFVFRLDESTLRSQTSAIHVDIFAARRRARFLPGKDTLLGTSRAVISTLRLSPATSFVALQIRRPSSLCPQGILNIGVALIDAFSPILPIYADFGAFAYHDLMEKPGKKVEKDLIFTPILGEMEKKLGKWRSEIPAVEAKEAEGDGSSRGKQRRSRVMSCFSIAGHYEDEIDEEGDGIRRRR